jgi:outer membrane receptor protein involved in Fe transport
MGAYVNPQYRPNKRLIFDLGGRVQVAPGALGSLAYDLNTTIAATVVWSFIPNWHLKLNYAQGFRPPVFNNTTSNGEGVQIGGNPNLTVETSDAAQAEINARIWKGERRIRELSFRVDGSYTRINNLIQISSGNYGNSGDRGIVSVEFPASSTSRAARLELATRTLRGDTTDQVAGCSRPGAWFNLATVFTLCHRQAERDLRTSRHGAAEDPNALPSIRRRPVRRGRQPRCG